jgi:serine protease Do
MQVNRFRFDYQDRRTSLVLMALIAGIVGALLVIVAVKFTGLGVALVDPPAVPSPSPPPPESKPISLSQYEQATIGVVNKVGPSVVMITTNTVIEDFDFFTGPEVKNIQGLGSGVIYRPDGYILTNNHVVNGQTGMASKIIAVLPNGRSYAAKVVGVDPQTDLALLKIDASGLAAPQWADSDRVQVGQMAIAIGNPLAENLNNTVTVGVISAKGRTLAISEEDQLRNMLQTDASINPGNSGGPLLDSGGSIIGLNTAIAANSQGIGFAIPSNTVRSVADQLIAKGYVSRPGLGIAYIHFTPEIVKMLEYRLGRRLPVNSGVFVAKVLEGSPAAKAGIRPGDIIVEVNRKPVKADDLIREAIATNPIGTKLKITYYRGSKKVQGTVKIGEMKR